MLLLSTLHIPKLFLLAAFVLANHFTTKQSMLHMCLSVELLTQKNNLDVTKFCNGNHLSVLSLGWRTFICQSQPNKKKQHRQVPFEKVNFVILAL